MNSIDQTNFCFNAFSKQAQNNFDYFNTSRQTTDELSQLNLKGDGKIFITRT
jgi:hypothetical protein